MARPTGRGSGAAQLLVISDALKRFTERWMKQATLDITANLTEDTPRDTSWARTNWVPKIGNKQREAVGAADEIATAQGEQSQGIAEVATTYTLERGKIFISNNVPYIGLLNDGSSTQAPAGFVQAAIQRAVTGE